MSFRINLLIFVAYSWLAVGFLWPRELLVMKTQTPNAHTQTRTHNVSLRIFENCISTIVTKKKNKNRTVFLDFDK